MNREAASSLKMILKNLYGFLAYVKFYKFENTF